MKNTNLSHPKPGFLKDKNLMDDKLFAICMQNLEFCKKVLSIILNVEVYHVEQAEIQKSIENMPGYKSIRLDVYAKTSDGIYNVEMQTENNDSMPKRARFYQGLLDVSNLYSGSEFSYKFLQKTVVIFITNFDIFGLGYYKYKFENYCKENKDLVLGDGSEKIFLNLNGSISHDESPELIQFLRYVKNSTNEVAKGYPRIEELDKFFRILKISKKVEENYMRSDWIAYEAEQKGIEKGIAKGIETGSEERKVKTIVNMYKKRMNSKDIMEICEVTADELVKILQDAGCIE